MTFNTLLFIDPFEKLMKVMDECWVAHKIEQKVEKKGSAREVNRAQSCLYHRKNLMETSLLAPLDTPHHSHCIGNSAAATPNNLYLSPPLCMALQIPGPRRERPLPEHKLGAAPWWPRAIRRPLPHSIRKELGALSPTFTYTMEECSLC